MSTTRSELSTLSAAAIFDMSTPDIREFVRSAALNGHVCTMCSGGRQSTCEPGRRGCVTCAIAGVQCSLYEAYLLHSVSRFNDWTLGQAREWLDTSYWPSKTARMQPFRNRPSGMIDYQQVHDSFKERLGEEDALIRLSQRFLVDYKEEQLASSLLLVKLQEDVDRCLSVIDRTEALFNSVFRRHPSLAPITGSQLVAIRAPIATYRASPINPLLSHTASSSP
ncbi:hypothetical protein BKA70DRAFT_187455 [Coprinopsis sp. MPI-PUGE-AT-0042]|nr:hypothetical protein BKA70DRAFT_187455 [Coprinopsis sp. MPI-PUGE-AT-0042]